MAISTPSPVHRGPHAASAPAWDAGDPAQHPDEPAVPSDALIQRARAGDADAFAAIYDHYARRIYAYCLSRVRRPADAEDLTQLTFLKVVEGLGRYESRGLPFAAWLFTIARNVVIDFVRARRDHLTLDELRATGAGDPPPETSARDALESGWPFLTPDQRDVLAYRFIAGLSVGDTARAMRRREESVRSLQHRALTSLRRRLAQQLAAQRPDGPALVVRATRPRAGAAET